MNLKNLYIILKTWNCFGSAEILESYPQSSVLKKKPGIVFHHTMVYVHSSLNTKWIVSEHFQSYFDLSFKIRQL